MLLLYKKKPETKELLKESFSRNSLKNWEKDSPGTFSDKKYYSNLFFGFWNEKEYVKYDIEDSVWERC